LLPFVIRALRAIHLLTLHEHGSSNPLGVSGNRDRLPFYPYFAFKDIVTFFLFFVALRVILFYAPNRLGHSDNYIMANRIQTPRSIVPEWYLLPFYAILRSIPNKLLGVIAMFSSLLIFLLLPLLDCSRKRGREHSPIIQFLFFTFVLNFILLIMLGRRHVEAPYIQLGQFRTRFYFA
jgi:ubiquinol-cytochrome c reductase cytochrome b subunit